MHGFGGWACDPSQPLCSVEQGLCAACQIFGATGWRRRFRLLVASDQTTPAWQGNQVLNIRPLGTRPIFPRTEIIPNHCRDARPCASTTYAP